ncbi:radical SAM family protein [Ruminiclostridium sufflavum DSM 19573]|uniref:Radical SAM family protein n=1 Tax=Ruminiclostridium sufflavum DSM 19573 TaxID=1121337 RepID=A0A318XMM6_9FIRM|nr:radical SAM protein [Ruminiclostridium sufflavum]PYG87948.1 radical SAM family protein [Ruminiclostridium sufflavum DSM 19573]
MKLLLLRPYYGITINSDMMGDLGTSEHLPQAFPDLPMIYAATIAKNDKSVQLDIIDANAEKLLPKDVIKRMNGKYDVIILKAASPTVRYDIDFAKYLKRYNYTSRMVFAGHTAKLLKKWIAVNIPEIDDVPEIPMEYYVNSMLENKLPSLDINEFPTPDYSLFPYDKYVVISGEKRGTLYMSRGCAVGCSYCPYASFYGKKFEFRELDKVLSDIKHLISLGFKIIQFRDQYFTANKKTVLELCKRIIEQGLKFDWYCETRLESLDTELIDTMTAAGMKFIFFGVESAEGNVLQEFNRPVYKHEKTKLLIDYLHKKNVITLAFYIVGFPNETWDTLQSTYNLAMKLESKCAVFSTYMPSFQEEEFKEQYPDKEITPDLFIPFEAALNLKTAKNFSMKQMIDIKTQLSFIYQANVSEPDALQDAFENHYYHTSRYINSVNNLRSKLEEISIMEL